MLAALVASLRAELAGVRAELARSLERVAELEARLAQSPRNSSRLAELFGIPLSPGTVAALTARAAGKLDGFLKQAREQIARSDAAGFDETGFRVEGSWPGCTVPAPASTPCSWRTPGAAGRPWRRWASCPGSPGRRA